MTKKSEPTEHITTDAGVEVFDPENLARAAVDQLPNPVLDRRQAYRVVRARVIDESLDEGEKLYKEGCIRRGSSPSHFVFTGKNGAKTRHDVHVAFEDEWEHNFWFALLCSCPTGRRAGDPCWHKGAVRAYLADNPHIRYANALLSLPLR